jgi:hypothetical protein
LNGARRFTISFSEIQIIQISIGLSASDDNEVDRQSTSEVVIIIIIYFASDEANTIHRFIQSLTGEIKKASDDTTDNRM